MLYMLQRPVVEGLRKAAGGGALLEGREVLKLFVAAMEGGPSNVSVASAVLARGIGIRRGRGGRGGLEGS